MIVGGFGAVSPPPVAAAGAPPTITSFSPVCAAVGDVIDVFGTNFHADRSGADFGVLFKTVDDGYVGTRERKIDSSTEMTAKVPIGVDNGRGVPYEFATAPLEVHTPDGNVFSRDNFEAPVITDVAPTTASPGQTITLRAGCFHQYKRASITVTFNGHAVSGTATTFLDRPMIPQMIDAVLPAGGNDGPICVTIGSDHACTTQVVHAPKQLPAVTRIDPSSGPKGTVVAINGDHFTGATAVHFGNTVATDFTLRSDGLITATAPAGSGTVDITATTSVGTSATSAADHFTYTAKAPSPTITGLHPHHGPQAGNTRVVIHGHGFSTTQMVLFGVDAATIVRIVSDRTIVVRSPAGNGTVDVRVVSPSGTSPVVPQDRFTYRRTR